jgi:peptidoglycan/xylan/chitin deacetylase (PgdA/CDA1 family)/sulfur carrier protein ThiS
MVLTGTTAGVLAAVATGKPTISIAVAGRHVAVHQGTTLAGAAHRLGFEPKAGNLLAVDGRVLRYGVFAGTVLVNGHPARGDVVLRAGDRVTVRDGAERLEPITREITPASVDHPANPQFFVNRVPGRSVVARGAITHKLAAVRFVRDGPPVADRAVALTFDDGPSPYTRAVLAILARYDVSATFFVVGSEVETYPELVRRELRQGMAVGNHSYDHPDGPSFAWLPHRRIRREVERTQKVLARLGVHPVLFRPPGGSVSPSVLRAASARGMRVVLWSVDPRDWVPGTTATEIVQRVLGGVQPGSIIVLHDGGGDRSATVEALPAIIAGIRERGLRFVALAPTG